MKIKAPIIILNVEVVEARSLEAKDANGFSDPYCMLGIIPGNRAHTLMDSLNNLSLTNQPSTSGLPTDSGVDNSGGGDSNPSPLSSGAAAGANVPGGVGNFGRTQTVSYLNPGRHSTKATDSSSPHKATTSLIKRFSSFRKSADKYAQHNQQQHQQQLQQQTLSQQASTPNLDKDSAASSRSTSHRLFASHKIVGALRDGKLPAKYIKTTDVKKATLNPIWNERFRL